MTTGHDTISGHDDAVDLSLRQFTGAWGLMCRDVPGAVIESNDGVDFVFSGLPIAFFNVAIVTGRDVDADRLAACGRHARDWAAGRPVPWLFVVTDERLAPGVDAAAALDAAGLAPALPLTGMLAATVAPLPHVPDGLTLSVPEDADGRAVMVDLNAAAYGMDLTSGRDQLSHASFWNDQVPVVGMVNGVPASCAVVLSLDGHRYVAWVATEPGHQRRGLADAVMRHALDVAASHMGELPTVLHATAAGRPVYERMGYQTISNHTLFMEKRFMGGH